jgi:hypothetical protein
VKKKFKTEPLVGKMILAFLGCTNPILEHYQERGTTVNMSIIVECFRTS